MGLKEHVSVFFILLICPRGYIMDNPCFERDSCSYNSDLRFPFCYCDEKCHQFSDCCKEYWKRTLNSNTSQLSVNKETKAWNVKCISISNNVQKVSDKIGFRMVTYCSKSKNACEAKAGDIESYVPVTNRKSGMTYRNLQCAKCHGTENNNSRWNIAFEIPHKFMGEQVVNEYKDDTFFEFLSKIYRDIPYTLNPPERVNPRVCHLEDLPCYDTTYENPVVCGWWLHKNFDCCYKDGCCKKSKTPTCPIFTLNDLGDENKVDIFLSGPKSFTALLKFSDHSTSSKVCMTIVLYNVFST